MNARDNLKPKSIRVAILQALSDGAITTIDDLQIKMDEGRTKIAQNIYPAAAEGLVKRMRDDVTNQAAYQITSKGRELLVKYSSGKEAAPADVVEAVAVEKSVITPSVKVEVQAPAFDMRAHLLRQREWSARTFGPYQRVNGVVSHIRKELEEVLAAPDDLEEWIDVVILALDGAWRAGYSPKQIIEALVAKQTKNEGRTWPDWRTAAPDSAIEHVEQDEQAKPVEPVGYVIQRPAKPLVRFTKAISAETRAMSFARTGQKAQVFALLLVGTAVPGSEWRKE